MGVTIKAGQAYITATPSSQDSQVLRARASSDYTSYTINANSSGSTKYDWIYLKVDTTKANNPASDASDVTSIYTSRSSSNTTDNGTPPTYGLLLAVVTVANGASSITNSNITDKRFNTSIGAQNGSLIVTQQATGDNAIIQAAGIDSNITVEIDAKGSTGNINLVPGSSGVLQVKGAQIGQQNFKNPYKFSVYRNGALTINAAGTNSGNTKITFETENFDTGSNYDSSTNYRFTAPIDGFYFFTAHTIVSGTSGNAQLQIWKNGSVIAAGNNIVANYPGLIVTCFLQLTANDYIEVYVNNASVSTFSLQVGNPQSTYFHGFLVSAT